MPKYEHLVREYLPDIATVNSAYRAYEIAVQNALDVATDMADNPDLWPEEHRGANENDLWRMYRIAEIRARQWLNRLQGLCLMVEEEYASVPWPLAREQGLAGFLRESGLIPGAYAEKEATS